MSSITLSSTAATRIGQCLRLLGSDKPGEVLAAVDALGRTLRSAGTDLHHLANVTERALRVAPKRVPPPPPPPPPSGADDVAGVIRFLAKPDVFTELSEKERYFVTNLERWSGAKLLDLTEKQTQWLFDIHRRVMRVKERS